MDLKQRDFYQKLRGQIKHWAQNKAGMNEKWSDFILLAPDLFHLLTRMTLDPDVPASGKLKLGAAIAYFISPLDFIPELFLGPIGYMDDIVMAAYVLNQLLNNLSPEVVSRHWAGDKDILRVIRTILINADQLIGSGIWRKIRKRFT